jgi:hypothetical protein
LPLQFERQPRLRRPRIATNHPRSPQAALVPLQFAVRRPA